MTVSGDGEPESVTEPRDDARGAADPGRHADRSGRGFTAEDDRPGAAPTVVISHGYWQRRFGGDTRPWAAP